MRTACRLPLIHLAEISSEKLKAMPVSTYATQAGEAVAIRLDLVQPPSTGAQVVLAGDWNWLPTENLFLHDDAFKIVPALDNNGECCPTRWKGHRAIDYILLTPQLRRARFLTAAYGDQKGALFDFQGRLVEGRSFARLPTLHVPS